MALSIKTVADQLIKHLSKLGIQISEKAISDLQDTGFINIEGTQCRLANMTSKYRAKIRVNLSWFNDGNYDPPFVTSGKMRSRIYKITLIPTENKLFFIDYSAVRTYAFELENDRHIWFTKPIWGIIIDEDKNQFKWAGGNTKNFPLCILSKPVFRNYI